MCMQVGRNRIIDVVERARDRLAQPRNPPFTARPMSREFPCRSFTQPSLLRLPRIVHNPGFVNTRTAPTSKQTIIIYE